MGQKHRSSWVCCSASGTPVNGLRRWMLIALASASAGGHAEPAPRRTQQVAVDSSTAAYGWFVMNGDDPFYGTSRILWAPGLSVSYEFRPYRHLAFDVVGETTIPGTSRGGGPVS